MDYKYIEQLLERYWAAETTEGEEKILRTFFSQSSLPERLERYRALFAYEEEQADVRLGEDFDKRLCQLAGEDGTVVKARRMSFAHRLRPFYHAAASVAIVTTLAIAAQRSFEGDKAPAGWDYNMAGYTDTYQSPQAAYDESVEALKLMQEGLKTAVADSAGLDCETRIMGGFEE